MTQANSPQPTSSAVSSNGLRSLWQWWSNELKTMLPSSMVSWFDGDAVASNVTVDEYGVTIITREIGATKSSPPRRVPIDALANSPVLRELIASGGDRVRLVLTPDQALVKAITLPLATEENLREVIGFELDRHTPFTLDQAYYDVQIGRRDPQHEKITVSLAVASKSEITALVDTLRRAGLTCTAIGISEAAASDATSFDLQPAFDKPPRRLSRTHQINLGLLGLTAVLGFAAVILPIWQKREAVKVLMPQAEKAGAEFQISERVYSEYVKLAAEYNFLAARKHALYPVVSVIEELARTFPDTTWVQKLDIKVNGKVREVTLLGEAQSTSKVIENLEQSPASLFQNSKQQSQTIPLRPNTERVHVSAEIKPRPVPALESIDEVVAPAATATIPATASPAPAVTPALPTATVAPVMTPMQPVPAIAPTAPMNTPLTTFKGPPPVPPITPDGKRSGT